MPSLGSGPPSGSSGGGPGAMSGHGRLANRAFGGSFRRLAARAKPARFSAIAVVVALGAMAGCARQSSTANDPTTNSNTDPLESWCEIAVELADAADSTTSDSAGGDPAGDRAILERLVEVLDSGIAVAPPEIKGDVELASDRAREISELLNSVGDDDSKLTDSVLERYQQAGDELAQASAVIANFDQRYCGVGTADPTRDQTIARLVNDGFSRSEASCVYDALLADGALAAPSSGASGVTGSNDAAALFRACGIDPARADEIVASLVNDPG